jgi:hypothetical protein
MISLFILVIFGIEIIFMPNLLSLISLIL